ncbi:FHR1 protein, partial [Calyptomena viridis]|nr:FHR1 protein [Calyptomena viridis]
EIPNGNVASTQQERYLPGARVHYQCESNFQTMGGNYITCINGEWSQAPVCRDMTCEPPPEIPGGNIEGVKKSRYLPEESAEYHCWQGFKMTGTSTVVCRNGTWTELPKCKVACTASEEDMERNNIELKWSTKSKLYSTSGDFIEFRCKAGYLEAPGSSAFRVQCMEGTLEYPQCRPGRKSSLSSGQLLCDVVAFLVLKGNRKP